MSEISIYARARSLPHAAGGRRRAREAFIPASPTPDGEGRASTASPVLCAIDEAIFRYAAIAFIFTRRRADDDAVSHD